MDAQQLDVIVRVAGVTLLALLAALLFRDNRSRRLAAAFAPLAICLSGFLIGNTPDAAVRLQGPVAAAAHLASGYAVVFLWWFCLTTFDQAFRPRRAVLAVGLGWLVIASADRGLLGPVFADRGLSWVLVAIGFGVIAHLAWRVMRDRAGDLVEVRRDARIVVVVLLAGLLLAELAKEVVFGIEWRPRLYTMAQNLALLAFAAWLLALVLRVSTESLAWTAGSAARPEAATPAVAGVSSPGEARLLARVRELIEVERVHLDPGMTFDAFVRRTGAPERAVRQLINHRLGHDHFRSFLNAHRTAEARRLLGDPGRAGDKLIAIAQDSGFASLASFNRAFLAVEGRAPSLYRAGGGAGGEAVGRLSGLNPAFEEPPSGF